MIPTTYSESGSRKLATIPYLHPREVEAAHVALDAGELVAVAKSETGAIGYGTIVALARPDLADDLVNRDADLVNDLRYELTEARRELANLRTIVGEVFAEKEPSDHVWKLEDAVDDVDRALDSAVDIAEEM
jgi:hypothetical protein